MVKGNNFPYDLTSTYLWITLNRTLTYRKHLETLRKKLTSRIVLIRRLSGTSWGARPSTQRTTTLVVYSTAEKAYCAPVWYCRAHTHLFDRPINDSLRIDTRYLKPTPTEYILLLSGIPPTEFRCKAATFSLARRSLGPNHIYSITHQQKNDQ